MRLRSLFSILLALGALSACNDERSSPTEPAPTEHYAAVVEVTAPSATVEMGETLPLEAVVRCEHGIELSRTVSWASSSESTATVDEGGVVHALVPGDVTIHATVDGVNGGFSVAVTGVFVGSDGGEVASDDGLLTLNVPAGALATTVEFVCRYTPGSAEPRDPGYVRTTTYGCEPGGLLFAEPALLRIEYDPDHMPDGYAEAELQIRHRARNSDTWAETNQNRVLEREHAIEAEIGGLSYFAVISVPAAEVIQITGLPDPPEIEVGGTVDLHAAVLDRHGTMRPEWAVNWASADPTIATVDSNGRVQGISVGATTITATYGDVQRDIPIIVTEAFPGGGHGGGGGEDHLGNNLSNPVIFAEGIGLTGLPVTEDAGLRPTVEEGIVVGDLPFFYAGNQLDYQGTYYLQQGDNAWQATWVDGALEGVQSALVYWGDNLTHHTWNTHSMIRVENVLESATSAALEGFAMTYLYGEGPDEMQGTDGSIELYVPTLFSVTPRLTIQKLDGEGGEPVYTAFEGAVHESMGVDGPGGYGAEVNVAGRVIYGYNFMIRNFEMPAGITKYGWWRITFSLDPQATVGGMAVAPNLSLDGLGISEEEDATAEAGEPAQYPPSLDTANQRTWLDIYVVSASGGGGGGGDHP